MRYRLLFISLIVIISSDMVYGQKGVNDAPQVLEQLFSRLANNSVDTDRLRINDSIRTIIDNYAASDSVFNHRFANLRYLGQITSSDNLLKILTWNLLLENSKSRYFCFFISRKKHGKENKVYRLSATYTEKPIRTDTIYSPKDWYGALYYDIKPYVTNGEKCWILLGIDYGNPLITRKIIDVISFIPGDSIIFGRKWFVSGGETKYRDVFQYSSTGTMSLRFSSDRSILFDHLVPILSSDKNDRQYYGPDYSFDAYKFVNGSWKLTINVDARNKK